MQRICRASERMSQLIDDLLKLAKVGRGEIGRGPVDLSRMAADIGAQLSLQEPGRDVRLDVQPGIVVPGDGRLLMIALENLLGNAWKFTRLREQARIRMFATKDADGWLIQIADNGTGFDMRYRHKLFAPFQRLHRAEEFEGTGIGLVTVSRIMARHDGGVDIDSVEDAGTTVSLRFPSAE
jgi:signal transduction histidine kinase